ncbi:unnamed protein product [Urochloa decumbens]|uniref:F-box protein AT5G49610-like beta-propeller domain-containing protein n=1 Tax=Urochloa decumbens TaxID=240449 RepID=A0ABC8VDP5_9POAL
MLGFLCDGQWDGDRIPYARFVPTSSCVPPSADHHGQRAFDAHHGRVLLHGITRYDDLAVWDPITDKMVEVPRPPGSLGDRSKKATVLCAANGVCDHIDCHRGPFIVVLVGTNNDIVKVDVDNDYIEDGLDEADVHDILWNGIRRVPKDMFACVYSSESGAWSKPTYAEYLDDDVCWNRSALVGNALYFVLRKFDRILKYDLQTRKMSTVRLPYVCTKMIFTDFVRIELTAMEDGRLGFARVEESNELCLWSRNEDNKVTRDEDYKVEGWTLCKVVDLKKLFPLVDSIILKYCLVGFVEGVCVAFVVLENGLFTIDMKSELMKKVYEGHCMSFVVPYISFCYPALEAASRDDGPKVGTSSASNA